MHRKGEDFLIATFKPLKNFIYLALITNFGPTFKDSIQTRHPQFGYLQIIMDLHRQNAVAC